MSAHFGPYEAVIFDMDGTLLDTEAVFKAVVWEVADEMGVSFSEALHLSIVGTSPETTRALVLEAFGAHFPYERFHERCTAESQARMAESVPLKAGAEALVAALSDAGVPLAVATSSRSAFAHARLEQSGLLRHFRAVVTRDDVQNAKPHPEPYRTAAARLGVMPPACLAFEDSHIGVRAAHAAGMRTVMVPDLLAPSDEIASLCHSVLDSLQHAHERLFGPLPDLREKP